MFANAIVCMIFLVSQASLFQALENVQQGTGENVKRQCRNCSAASAVSGQQGSDLRSRDFQSWIFPGLNRLHRRGNATAIQSARDGTRQRSQQIRTSTYSTNPLFNNAKKVSATDERLAALNMKACGLTPSDDRIINGKEAARHQFCFMAQLYYKPASSYYRSNVLSAGCGGSLIHVRWVLTAAHCMAGSLEARLEKVHLGEHDTLSDPDCWKQPDGSMDCSPKVQRCDIALKISHPDYNPKALVNDIGLLYLNESAKLTYDSICISCMPVGKYQFFTGENSSLVVSGWGTTENNTMSKVLMSVQVPHVDLDTCWNNRSLVTKSPCLICAGGGSKDSCTGDSGGPITTLLPYNETVDNQVEIVYRVTQLGCVSYGPTPCAKQGKMGVYTLIGCFVDFILSHIAKVQS